MLSPFLSKARHEWVVAPGTGDYAPLVAASSNNSGRSEREEDPAAWRMKERMKTVSVALVLCLNIGTDPPDVVKTSPCARKECWVDPLQLPPQKALESVGKTLQLQYADRPHPAISTRLKGPLRVVGAQRWHRRRLERAQRRQRAVLRSCAVSSEARSLDSDPAWSLPAMKCTQHANLGIALCLF